MITVTKQHKIVYIFFLLSIHEVCKVSGSLSSLTKEGQTALNLTVGHEEYCSTFWDVMPCRMVEVH